MKNVTLLGLLLGAAALQPALAQTPITIGAARALATGYGTTTTTTVTVRGTVTNGAELGNIRYIQDATGGIGVFLTATAATPIVVGDSIQATGFVQDFRGLLEISGTTTNPVVVTALGRARKAIAPITVPASAIATAFAEANEGRLVRITGVTSISTTAGAATGNFPATASNYILNGNPAWALRSNAALSGSPIPSGTFDVTGVMGQFASAAPGTDGYQLLVRTPADIVVRSATRAGSVLTTLQAYPNPAQGSFRLSASPVSGPATISLIDATGRLALRQTQTLAAGQEVAVDARQLPAGLYLLQVSTPGATRTGHVVVE